MSIPTRHEAIAYLEEALERLKNRRPNAVGGEMQAGEAYWRIAKALRYVDDVLVYHEGGDNAASLRNMHGQLCRLSGHNAHPR